MKPLYKGKYLARAADGTADLNAALALRSRCFGVAGGAQDVFDATAIHVLVHEATSGVLVCTYRLMAQSGAGLCNSYAAQFYDLSALARFDGPMLELGRFCVDPTRHDPDIVRIAWAALTAYVDAARVQLLFGCASFAGIDPDAYRDCFALLKARHLAPPSWRPKIKAEDVFRYAARLRRAPDPHKAHAEMPQLLRTYLMMGGWVSDHAVVDRQMGTLHVFTGLEIGAIPESRKRLLRALV